MGDEKTVTATRAQLVEAFKAWDAQAKAENWTGAQNAEASADHLIALLGRQ